MTDEAKTIIDALTCTSKKGYHCGACKYLIRGASVDRCNENQRSKDAADLIERVAEENERLHYTLQGVMHFVDKWIDGEPYYDIDDPDGKIAVNRAAEARECALKIIDNLNDILEQVKRERDAAVYDLTICADCTVCKNHHNCEYIYAAKCAEFIDANEPSPLFDWRGACEENNRGEEV